MMLVSHSACLVIFAPTHRECLPGQCPSLGLPKLCSIVSTSNSSSRSSRHSRVAIKPEPVVEAAAGGDVDGTMDAEEDGTASEGEDQQDDCCRNTAIQTRTFPAVDVFLTEPSVSARTDEATVAVERAGPASRCTQKQAGPSRKGGTAAKSVSKGYGLRLVEAVDRGTIIVEYLGEVITAEEGLRRMRHYAIDDAFYFAGLDNGLMLDAKAMGSVARFANHSCDPTCELQKWSVQGECRLVLVALKDLLPGEEVRSGALLQCAVDSNIPRMVIPRVIL